MRDWTGLLLLAIVGVPVALVLLYLHRPYSAGSVPRDSLAMRGKAEEHRAGQVFPSQAFDDNILDVAADQPKRASRHTSN